jgi:hypothetical protein
MSIRITLDATREGMANLQAFLSKAGRSPPQGCSHQADEYSGHTEAGSQRLQVKNSCAVLESIVTQGFPAPVATKCT